MLNIETEICYSFGAILDAMTPMAKHIKASSRRGVDYPTAVRRALRKFPLCEKFITLDSQGLFAVRPEWLFANWEICDILLYNPAAQRRKMFQLPPESRELMSVVSQLNLATNAASLKIEELTDSRFDQFRPLLVPDPICSGAARRRVPRFDFARRGIHRLQHASSLIRSRTTGVLLDPNFQCIVPDSIGRTMRARDVVPNVDAVLITHSHVDHFHLGSMLHFPKDTPVVVPKVPRSSLASLDIHAILRSVGFTDVRALDWFSRTQVGDTVIEVLPFYGEQTSATEEIHMNLINHGNTYLIRTPDFSVWPLADSGRDIRGSMVELAGQLVSRGKEVDVVLAGIGEASLIDPLSLGGVIYWLCLSPEQRLSLHRRSGGRADSVTLGRSGLFRIGAVLKPKWLLPYNSDHSNIGTRPPFEGEYFGELAGKFKRHDVPTSVGNWNVGDCFEL